MKKILEILNKVDLEIVLVLSILYLIVYIAIFEAIGIPHFWWTHVPISLISAIFSEWGLSKL